MTYVVSNLYGRYDKFEKILKKVSFKDRDVLYILGNIVDHGSDSIKLVNDISTRLNVYSVLGEHDYKAFMLLSEFERILKGGGVPTESFSKDMIAWAADGGQITLEAFKDAEPDEQEGFLDYLSDLPVFEEASVGDKEYILTCRGVRDFEEDKDLFDYDLDCFVEGYMDMDKTYYKDKIMVVGYLDYEHTPAGCSGKVISKNNNIALACDMSVNDDAICFCLENGEVYYV